MEKIKILVIDDEKDFTDMLKMNLEETGEYKVMAETEGASSLETAKKFKPDLILLDIIMPDMDGSAVLARLKDDISTAMIPVVFLTAIVTDSEASSRDNIMGGYPVIAKPVSMKKLIECIRDNVKKGS